MNKPSKPEKKEVHSLELNGCCEKCHIHHHQPSMSQDIGYNNGLQDERDWWHKWIDEAPIEEVLRDLEIDGDYYIENKSYIGLAKAIRKLLKGGE